MKVLHISTDEKFIDSARWQFETVLPKQNTFVVIISNKGYKLKYIKNGKDFTLKVCSLDSIDFLVDLSKKYDLVCFHGLDYFRSRIILKLPTGTKILWLLWGIEVYNNPRISKMPLYGIETQNKFYRKSPSARTADRLKDSLRPLYFWVFFHSYTPNYSIKKAVERVNYCGVLYKEELDFIKQRTKSQATFLKFCYYPLELILKGNMDAKVNGENILIGNSASLTNNHLDIFKYIEQLPIKEKKLIVPLNYGDLEYGKEIISIGSTKFANNFCPITKFMDLQDYNKILKSCGLTIIGSIRQQAIGTVLIMVYMGSKVFLDERNSVYKYLQGLEVKIFSINKDLRSSNEKVFNLLTEAEKEKNRNILVKEIGQKALLAELKNQLQLI